MFNSTFFKSLLIFAIIIAVSFLIMGIAGGVNTTNQASTGVQKIDIK